MKYQTFGFGVNSVALAEILPSDVERVFSDPGAEEPETYGYIDYYLPNHKVKILTPEVEGYTNIYEYYYNKVGCPPFRAYRSCTDKFKVRVLEGYMKTPAKVYIGIAYDERHRVKIHEKGGFTYEYPLVDEKITRKGCIEIIEDAGLRVPPKSGCFFCPFQHRLSWQRLARNHPELYWKAVALEELSDKIDLHPKGLRNLWPPPLTLTEALNPEEDWECGFCFTSLDKQTKRTEQ